MFIYNIKISKCWSYNEGWRLYLGVLIKVIESSIFSKLIGVTTHTKHYLILLYHCCLALFFRFWQETKSSHFPDTYVIIFSYIPNNLAKFEVFCQTVSSSLKPLFLKSCLVQFFSRQKICYLVPEVCSSSMSIISVNSSFLINLCWMSRKSSDSFVHFRVYAINGKIEEGQLGR